MQRFRRYAAALACVAAAVPGASAVLLLMYTFVGLALGPFAVGRVSDLRGASGSSERFGGRFSKMFWWPAADLMEFQPRRVEDPSSRKEHRRHVGLLSAALKQC